MELKSQMMKNKKGALGLDVTKEVMLALLTLAVIGVAVILALTSLQNSNVMPAGSAGYNNTAQIIGNVTSGTTSFFGSTGTIFGILVVVVIIAAISLIIYYVSRFSQAGQTTIG